MFTLIEQESSSTQKSCIDSLRGIINKNHMLTSSFATCSKANYILTETATEGFFGGAILLKQDFSLLHKDLRKSLTSLYNENEIWTCSVALSLEGGANIEETCKTFYVEL